MLDRRRFIVGAALIAAAVSYLVYAGIRSSRRGVAMGPRTERDGAGEDDEA